MSQNNSNSQFLNFFGPPTPQQQHQQQQQFQYPYYQSQFPNFQFLQPPTFHQPIPFNQFPNLPSFHQLQCPVPQLQEQQPLQILSNQGQYSQFQQQVEENKISKQTEERIRQIQNITQEPFDKASQNLSSLNQFAHEEQMNNDDVNIENSLIEFDQNEEISQENVSGNKTLTIV